MKKSFFNCLTAILVSIFILGIYPVKAQKTLKPDANNGGIKVPQGFGALQVVPKLGRARHIAIDQTGNIFVKLSVLKDGKGIYILRDTDGDGKADDIKGFGNYIGTGIAIGNGYLYSASDSSVYRYPLTKTGVDTSKMEIIVASVPYSTNHPAKSITLDNEGKLYMNIGAPSNACQEKDRVKGSPGMDPCPLLENYGGIWQFDANKQGQREADGTRFATGLRNCVALEWDSYSKQLFAVQHGRDQLDMLFPNMYTHEQNAELPAEEFFMLKKGSDCGWPYCYYDQFQKKLIQSPEYGGDGKKADLCEGKELPIMAFPGHWAPNDLLFYHGNQFPEKYKNGAFICFHGSWNRAPLKQAGYFVAFIPFKDGKPSGDWEVFAEGFAGGPEIKSPNDAKHRPMGLAEGPDGSLYITDSVDGTVWRVIYKGTK